MAKENEAGLVLGAVGAAAGLTALIAALMRPATAEAAAQPDTEVRQALAVILTQLIDIGNKLDRIEEKVNIPPSEGGVRMTTEIQYVTFTRTLLPLEGILLYEKTPFAGTIKEVKINWPDGCNNLVGVSVHHGQTQFLPRSGYLRLNDVERTYVVDEAVADTEEIWVDENNGDIAKPHTITVDVRVERQIPEVTG